MRSTRREFLSQSALVAAAAGLGPGIGRLLAQSPPSSRPYLDLALRCALWIDKSIHSPSSGRSAWPADPLKPGSIGLDFYNGMPGVVYFYANLYRATGDAPWLTKAVEGATYLHEETERLGDKVGAGLYTGLAGLAFTHQTVADAGGGAVVAAYARNAARQLAARARAVEDAVEWSDSNDIIGGTAGIGLFLLNASSRWSDKTLADLATRAGRRLIAKGVSAEGGLMWFPSGMKGANYPNFAHGTAGIAYFFARLYASTNDPAFYGAAVAGAKYLDAIATRTGDSRKIFHVSGAGENRFYMSWCHGPAGTARLYYQLFRVAPINAQRAFLVAVNELSRAIPLSGAPETQSAGYWNNISQCCGSVGIGQFYIDLARHFSDDPSAPAMYERALKHTLSRATDDAQGLRWMQAENRVSPDAQVAQTGFMQGAAGVGTFLLQLDAHARGTKWLAPLPDTPW